MLLLVILIVLLFCDVIAPLLYLLLGLVLVSFLFGSVGGFINWFNYQLHTIGGGFHNNGYGYGSYQNWGGHFVMPTHLDPITVILLVVIVVLLFRRRW